MGLPESDDDDGSDATDSDYDYEYDEDDYDDESEDHDELEYMLGNLRTLMDAHNRRTRQKTRSATAATKATTDNSGTRKKNRHLGATQSALTTQRSANAALSKCVECKKTHVSVKMCGLGAYEDACRRCKMNGKRCSGPAIDGRFKTAVGGRWHKFKASGK